MPLYMIERNFAEQLSLSKEGVDGIQALNADFEDMKWLFSFLSADKKKTYCLYEAASPDDLRAQAEKLGIPADVIVEVDRISPEAFV